MTIEKTKYFILAAVFFGLGVGAGVLFTAPGLSTLQLVVQLLFQVAMPIIAWNALQAAKGQWAIAESKASNEARQALEEKAIREMNNLVKSFSDDLVFHRPQTPNDLPESKKHK